jgi:hypothetical protein
MTGRRDDYVVLRRTIAGYLGCQAHISEASLET